MQLSVSMLCFTARQPPCCWNYTNTNSASLICSLWFNRFNLTTRYNALPFIQTNVRSGIKMVQAKIFSSDGTVEKSSCATWTWRCAGVYHLHCDTFQMEFLYLLSRTDRSFFSLHFNDYLDTYGTLKTYIRMPFLFVTILFYCLSN